MYMPTGTRRKIKAGATLMTSRSTVSGLLDDPSHLIIVDVGLQSLQHC